MHLKILVRGKSKFDFSIKQVVFVISHSVCTLILVKHKLGIPQNHEHDC